ncbi:MAG: triphosphoribosyl-dephospho-CoA synthase [Gammaproteobacteria bacterium]
MASKSEIITQAVYKSCITEIKAFKPGNVSIHSEGHGMEADDFIRSAELISPVMGNPDLTVGERILQSVQLTMSQVGCNTNLGIILLVAPLAQAAFISKEDDYLQQTIHKVLDNLTIEDATLAFEAIELANPGGLGDAPEHDVKEPATITLLAAMKAAQYRDRIAWQYANGYQDIFQTGTNTLRMQVLRWKDVENRLEWATVACYLKFMTMYPDSHVIRKFDLETAENIRKRTESVETMFTSCINPSVANSELRRYDGELKRVGVNPGTSADLTVASLVALSLEALL